MDLRLTTDAEAASDPANPVAHDLYLSGNAPTSVTGVAAIAQSIKQRLLFFRGEWFLDERLGVPWYTLILGKGHSDESIAALLRKVIATTAGVREVTKFVLNRNAAARSIAPSFDVATNNGDRLTFTELNLGGVE